MRSSRSNLLTTYNLTGRTELNQWQGGGPVLAAKISPGGTDFGRGTKIFVTYP